MGLLPARNYEKQRRTMRCLSASAFTLLNHGMLGPELLLPIEGGGACMCGDSGCGGILGPPLGVL